ncbi:SGNH/GDSL hydrolase family protein [Nitrococcus mobilis]|uniref:Lipolytic enzyme, G-D-S-L n=1 Tax=Nitrococcus mobilis Nb-231 TaxID=314278 RepID=A4BTJ6_9GAMM|nr:SGNH/GDSL hydrolase family protein [Nitrococcus mobilis]EAR20952.1 Lipolytic enzyme, G-D-S-L [Nitrococcus mobilis Nb-231]
MKYFAKRLAAAVLVGSLSSNASAGPVFSEMVVFGDSLSDAGNVLITTTASPIHMPDPPAFFGYVDGRATNGPNWVDRLAQALGVPVPEASLAGGTNYAFAGAKSGFGTNVRMSPTFPPNPPLDVQRVGSQIDAYLGDRGSFSDDQLISLWVGANDLRDATSPADIVSIVDNLETHIRTLDDNGAGTVLVPNQLNLSLIPFFDLPISPDPADVLAGVLFFNSQLEARLSFLNPLLDIDIVTVDMFTLSQAIVGDPSAFGLSNVDDPALDQLNNIVAPNPDEYLFWDLVHPTRVTHRIIGEAASVQLITEPDASSLFSLALIVFGLRRLVCRRRQRGANFFVRYEYSVGDTHQTGDHMGAVSGGVG